MRTNSELSAGTYSIRVRTTDMAGDTFEKVFSIHVKPMVTGVNATTANGTYKVGDTIAITVGFSDKEAGRVFKETVASFPSKVI